METFLSQKSVKDALGVGDIDFVSCSTTVYDAMVNDWMRNLEVGIPALLEDGIKVLVYAGEYDLICNWLGKPTLYFVQSTNQFLIFMCLFVFDRIKFILYTIFGSLFCRKLKVGSGHAMVWPEKIRRFTYCSFPS